jgi:hypothetical protein
MNEIKLKKRTKDETIAYLTAKIAEIMSSRVEKTELMGLWLILDDVLVKETNISREYVQENLKRIAQGKMIFHPVIKEKLTEENYERWITRE